MTREDAIKQCEDFIKHHSDWSVEVEWAKGVEFVLKDYKRLIEQAPCEDIISRKSIKQKLQEHHDFFVNAYGGFSNLPQNDKSRVDEITNCIAMVVNEPPVTPQSHKSEWEHDHAILKAYSDGASEVLDKLRAEIIELRSRQNVGVLECLDIIDKYRAESEG